MFGWKKFYYFSGINSNSGLPLGEEYPKVSSSTSLPAFNRLSTPLHHANHRNVPYSVPNPSYNDWPYEPTANLQYNILSTGGGRNRQLSASQSLTASK